MWEGLNAVATCISALAACFATYFAASTLKQSNLAKRAEFLESRPLFTFASFALTRPTVSKALSTEKEILDPRVGIISGYIRNSGRRPACNVSGFVFVLPHEQRKEVKAFPIGIADDAMPNTEWNVKSGYIQVVPDNFPGSDVANYNDPDFFVAIAIAYDDTAASTSYTQVSFMKWPGVTNNVVSGVLIAATSEEKRLMLQQHANLLLQFQRPPNNAS
ncbi:hypothetical protein [Rheinheimera oceanensis]|uniref:hypothetical protein n=1 Tax=Rheinheimera oceanensis TaxID=2817449 RepID=UPI001BFE849E|nr:hypothetical protein [Rheinheimera oceanensis]